MFYEHFILSLLHYYGNCDSTPSILQINIFCFVTHLVLFLKTNKSSKNHGCISIPGELTDCIYNKLTISPIFSVTGPPEIMPFHFSSSLKEGGKAHIACTVVSGDLPISFTWRKDGKPLAHDPDIHEQVLEMVSTLRINNLAARHTGLYTCIASNPAASSNYTAKLVVKGKM